MDATGILSQIAIETKYNKLPPQSVENAKVAIMDAMACALVGSAEPLGKMVTRYARKMGGKRQAGVLANGFKTSVSQAALANGAMAHALDYDDSYGSMEGMGIHIGHQSGVLMPCILALGEMNRSSGKDIITAYIAGLEVGARLGKVMRSAPNEKGFHPTGIFGSMAATAAAANLLGLNEEQTRMAFGISASLAAGLRGNFGTMTKPLHSGSAASNGVVSALLAGDGFTANNDIIDTDLGYLAVFSIMQNQDINKLAEKPKGGFYSVEGNSYKLMASGFGIQSSLEAILDLIQAHGITADQVESVEELLNRPHYIVCTRDGISYTLPQTGLEAKFVLPYGLGAALIDGKITLATFTDEMVQRPDLAKMFSRIKTRFDPASKQEIITIRLKDGTKYTKNVGISKGRWPNPVPKKELIEKYRDCASYALPKKDSEQALDLLMHLEDQAKITELMTLLTGDVKPL